MVRFGVQTFIKIVFQAMLNECQKHKFIEKQNKDYMYISMKQALITFRYRLYICFNYM